jgi:hypothetical protein
MRRGSLSERTNKCSKTRVLQCQDPKARHGPYCSLTRAVEDETPSRYLTAEQAVLAHQQIEAGKGFRTQLEAYWKRSEDWADCVTPASQPDSFFRKRSYKRGK